MHTLLFLEPAHFHATLTLRERNPGVSDEVIVYASPGLARDVRDFLDLIERFNGRTERPTRWRPVVVTDADPLSRLIAERRGDVVVLAGRNAGKALTFHRLHVAGFHVLADKPWLVEPEDLEDIRASLTGWPLVMEIMTGRHDVAARLFKRLVGAREIFGDFRDDGPAIELASEHHLAKLVDGVPLRRPWWFFDVTVQGGGAVDIPTHVVDQTQWLLEGLATAPSERPRVDSARAWPTPVTLDAFRRITGEPEFPPELRGRLAGGVLAYFCNAELAYRIGPVAARASVAWRLQTPPGGGDTHVTLARGTGADVRMERNAETGYRRRLLVAPHAGVERAREAITETVAGLPGVGVVASGAGGFEVTIAPAMDTGHESHFPFVLEELLKSIDEHRWPSALVERTLAKYTLLAEAASRIRDAQPIETPTEESR